jgi:subtilisin family serine protease
VPPGAEGEPDGLVVTPATLPPEVTPAGTVVLPNGGQVNSVVRGGKTYVPIEATFSERSWQAIVGKAGFDGLSKEKRDALVRDELKQVLSKIDKTAHVVGADILPSVGWVSAYIPADAYASLAGITGIGRRLLVNPIVSTPMKHAERDIKRDKEMGFAASAAFDDLEGLVGLSRMGVDEFIRDAQADLNGYKPDGSHIKLGVVDTGITYNHPAFRDAAGKSRIDSMRDFTGEGRIFFIESGRFEVKAGGAAGELLLSVDHLEPSKTVDESPDPGKLVALDNEKILVSPELKTLLTAPNASGARFGVLDELAFGGPEGGLLDIDHNGKTDDRFYAILIPGSDDAPDALYVAFDGKGDFRKSPRLTSFDLAKETQPVFAERVGFDIKKETILDAAGADVAVTTAAIVGFDPGNHGSHVAGIAAARKMIANAPDDTKLHGVAPLARIASGRICANSGGCAATKAIVALSDAGANVINMSIGSLGPDNDGYGVQEAIIDRLTVQNGTVFVIAASNDGPGRQTVGSPAVARNAISVAATASAKIIQDQYKYPGSGKVPSTDGSDDYLLYFSSRGPSSAGGMKPEIAAPGTWLSAIQLNSAPGEASGLEVMWGTSMASPAAAGAVALLMDAAKVYNDQHAASPVAIDAITLRRVILASARPFDVTTLNPKTAKTTKGQYTWIDEGFGMINLQRAWKLLKQERGARQPAAITYSEDGVSHEVPVDYQVRILRKNPNGQAYDGSQVVEGAGDTPEAKYARGLWIDAKATESLYRVQVARRLPSDVVARPDVADLSMQLKTTADEFELETTIHGSHLDWVQPGVLNGNDCVATAKDAKSKLLVIGEGAVDQPIDPATGKGGSVAQPTSTLNLCVNRKLVDMLPPGDHGAVVTAYRVVGNKREAIPSFVVPVYVTVPHKTMAGVEGLHISSTVDSFGVARHYIDVPKDTNIVKVSLDLPAATKTGTSVNGCAGVSLEALEGGNTFAPPEFAKNPSDAIAMNCSSQGAVAPDDWRHVQITRSAPRPGIWDLHVFGLYQFTSSPYTIDVQFAKVTSSKVQVDGTADALNGTFDVEVVDASYPLVLSTTTSSFALTGFTEERSDKVAEKDKLRVPNAKGEAARKYGADIGTVTIATGLSAGNDLDLEILECDDAALTTCTSAGLSGTPTDVESVTFTPQPGKFYAAEVTGYAIKANDGAFMLREDQVTKNPEKGTLTFTQPSPKVFAFTTAFDVAGSAILADPRHATDGRFVSGAIDLKDEAGTNILSIPVRVRNP